MIDFIELFKQFKKRKSKFFIPKVLINWFDKKIRLNEGKISNLKISDDEKCFFKADF